jgi:hypothetical protein
MMHWLVIEADDQLCDSVNPFHINAYSYRVAAFKGITVGKIGQEAGRQNIIALLFVTSWLNGQ